MKLRLVSALLISILLIGGAGWVRASQTSSVYKNNLVSLTGKDTESQVDPVTINNDFYANTNSPDNLNATDLISHQLIVDYVNLAASGGATEENINALAQKYVESLPTLNKTVLATFADISTVSNTKSNFQNYADSLMDIEKDYSAEILKTSVAAKSINKLGSSAYSLMKLYSNEYEKAANKLKTVPTPIALAQNHLKLINIYLSLSSAMEAISNTEKDSAFAFVGLVTAKQKMDEEDVVIKDIEKILSENGI